MIKHRPDSRILHTGAVDPSPYAPGSNGGVPSGYTRTTFYGRQVYFKDGVLNVSGGQRVFDNGESYFVKAN